MKSSSQFAMAIATFFGCTTLAAPAAAEDWYRWRGPGGTGISGETEWTYDWPDGRPPIAWTVDVGVGFSSCVTQAERVYTIGHLDDHSVVHCLDVNDGRVIWQFAYAATLDARDFEGGSTSTPTIDADRVYVLSRVGELFCLDARTGEELWRRQIADELDIRVPGWGFAAAPLVVGDKLLLTMGEAGVALNKLDGALIWKSADKECGYAAPALIPRADGTTVIFPSGRQFSGVDLETGKPLWSERWLTSFGCNAADPIVHAGKVFLSSGYNRGAALFDLAQGQPIEVWKNKELQNQLHSSLLYQGHLYGIDGNMEFEPRVKCLEWSTGKVVWSRDDLNPGGLALADGKLILLTASGELVIAPATPQGFTELARGKVLEGKCWTVPVLSGGRIFCRAVQGQLACVDVRPAK